MDDKKQMNYRPDYLTSADHHWLGKVLDKYIECDGLVLRKIHSRLEQIKIPNAARQKYLRAIKFLDKQVSTKNPNVSSREIRMAIFTKVFAYRELHTKERLNEILKEVSSDLGMNESTLTQDLLSDIDGEEIACGSNLNQDLYDLANEINLLFAKSLIKRAEAVTLTISDNSRRVIRQAKLMGLICNIERQTSGLRLNISGPLSILRKTNIYGSGLASLLESVVWCQHFQLSAICSHKNRPFQLQIKTGDPIRPSKRPKTFDSKIEEKFAKAVTKKLPSWLLVREPEPIETSEGIIFPDFLLQHETDQQLRFFCEIIGFWTQEYLEKKLRQWSCVRETKFVLCISEKLRVKDEFLPQDVPIYFFKSNIDPVAVLQLAQPQLRN